MPVRSMLVCCFLLLGTWPARPATEPQRSSGVSPLLYTVAKSYEPLAWMHGEERFPFGAAIFIKDENGQRAFLPDFTSSADTVISFDGKRVAFSGKRRASDPWQIWEVSLQGSAARQITSGSEHCIRPLYLPEDRLVYARKIAGRFVVELAEFTGGKPLSITHIPASAIPNDVLRDGRILFTAAFPLGTGAAPEIYTVYSDGSGVESYRCDHGNARHSGKQITSGDVIFLSEKSVSRFTSARAQEIHVSAPAGEFGGDLVETPAGEWLLSWRPDARSNFAVVRWKQGQETFQPVLVELGGNIVQPVLVASHATPNGHPSGLHDWPTGNLLCLNAYTSKYSFVPGSIHGVRLYTPDAQGTPRLLGSAAVERDGSFFVQVPGDLPLQIELLDATGKTLKREAGFFWMRRGEQRGCVGCHAGPETAPENAVPMALLKSTTPADLTGAASQNASGGH